MVEQPQTHEMLQQTLGETAPSSSKTCEWYSNFISGRTSIDDHMLADHQEGESPTLLTMSMS